VLPEDGIPVEILSVARHSNDIDSVIHEHEGYVPSEDMEDMEGSHKALEDEVNGMIQYIHFKKI
jgi:hypothetical protein